VSQPQSEVLEAHKCTVRSEVTRVKFSVSSQWVYPDNKHLKIGHS